MNDKKEVLKLKPFTKFLFTIGELPTSYLISMTYEEQLLWFCNYLKETVIPTINNNAEAIIELQEYVANYFDNLDVQEEISNKLDKMAQDGSLTALIKEYIDPIYQSYEAEINQSINNFTNSVDNRITLIDDKVNAVGSGAPLVASSTSGMTDTSRVYVNTTDGKWYYYNGTAWTIGGTYQSAEDSETVTELEDLVDEITEIGKNKYSGTDVIKDNTNRNYIEETLEVPIPAGTYTMSAVVRYLEGGHTVIKTNLRFRNDGGEVAQAQIDVGYPERTSVTFTLSEEVTKIRFYGSTGSTEEYWTDKASYTNIQIEVGLLATDYVPFHISAIDTYAREKITQLSGSIKYVSTNGDDSNTGDDPTSPLATIQHAVALGGRTVVLEFGTYTENFKNTGLKEFTLIGNGSTIQYSDGETACFELRNCFINIIDTIFDASGTETSISGAHFRDCTGRVENCIFKNAHYMGARLDGSNLTLIRCEAFGNNIDGFNAHDTARHTSDCTFIDCFAHNNHDDGLSFHENGKIHVHGGEYYDNDSTGIAPHNNCNCEIIGAYIHNNDSGIEAFNTSPTTTPYPVMVVNSCIITNNTSDLEARGYGISVKYYEAYINATAIENNQKGKIAQDSYSTVVRY